MHGQGTGIPQTWRARLLYKGQSYSLVSAPRIQFNINAHQASKVKRYWIISGAIGVLLMLVSLLLEPQKRLVWNRTESAPLGLYWLSNDPITKHCWVIVSAGSDASLWAQKNGFVGASWPLIKRVYGIPGDQICRSKNAIFVNEIRVAEVHNIARNGAELPRWEGCFELSSDEYFLLNTHPNSLDGRYFGATHSSDLDGAARLIIRVGG